MPTRTVVVPALQFSFPEQLRENGWFISSPSRLLPFRTQSGYATGDFKLSKAMLLSVAFRPPQYVKSFFSSIGGGTWHNPEVTLGLDVSMSHGPSLPRAFSRTFAANHGKDLTSVFSGSVTWPRWDLKDDDSKFIARIPFQRPFPFDVTKGQSLVLDIRTLSNSRTTDPQYWTYEVAMADRGGMLGTPNVPMNCHPTPIWRPFNATLYPGGSWQTAWKVPAPPSGNKSAIASIGFTGAGSKWGNILLPFAYTTSSCRWGVASELFWGFTLDASGYGMIPPLPIPNVQSLTGLRFFDQCAVLDPNGNAVGIVALPSNVWGIATTRLPEGQTVSLNNDRGQPDGGVTAEPIVARAEFEYH